MIEPGKIAAGDSLEWTRNLSDYKASDGWTLHYALFNASAHETITSAADGDNHVVSVDSTTTAGWAAGRYDWTAYVTHTDGRKRSLFTGNIIITPDLTAGPYDGRSHARKMLDAIEAALEGRATADELDLIEAHFGDRAIERNTAELTKARNDYRLEVKSEENTAALERGEKRQNKTKVRFNR